MEVAQLITAVALVAFTGVLAWATWRYTTATERLAVSSEHRPYVYLFMQQQGAVVGLRNIGDRIAHDVVVEVHQDDKQFLIKAHMFKDPIASIGPGSEVKDSLNLGVIVPGDTAIWDFTVRYRDAKGRQFEERVRSRVAENADWFQSRPLAGVSERPGTRL